jgi:hypothetical protein
VTGGANNELVEIEEGTRMIVNMASLTIGWQKWEGDRPVDAHMGLVNEGYQAPLRRALGDNKGDGGWEKDKNGVERDPWQPSNMVVMREIGTKGDTEGVFTFATSSRGGINAIGVLSKRYGSKIREDEEAMPIVELKADSYMHRIKKLGEIDIPILNIVGWGTVADLEDATRTVVEKTKTKAVANDDDKPEVKQFGQAPGKAEHARASATKKPDTAKAAPKKAAAGKRGTRF